MPNMKRFIFQSIILFFFPALLLSMCFRIGVGSAQGRAREVLILHSYHKADWTDSLNAGIFSVLDNQPQVDLVIEYMDTKRIKSDTYYGTLSKIYELKYHDQRFEVILTSDDNAYRFALARQDSLFKGTPIVFCGVNRFDPQEISKKSMVTGVVEEGDFGDTLRFAMTVRPDAIAIHVILDKTATARINKENFVRMLERNYPDLRVDLLNDLSLAGLSDHLAKLPVQDFVFFISFWQDANGRPVSPDNLSNAFYNSTVPVFGRSEWMMGKGLTGGKCVSGFHQGEAAALMVERILQGEDVSAIPFNRKSPNRFMFDCRLLQRYGIDPAVLPPGSILFNKPAPTFYEKYRLLFWSVVSVVAILSVLVVLLGLNIVTRRRTEKALRDSEKRYRTLVENAADAIFLSDADGKLVDVNHMTCENLGYTREELLAGSVEDIDANFNSPEFLNQVWKELQPGRPVSIESNHRRKDGSVFPVQLRIAVLDIEDKRFILGLAHDISERKKMEAELRESEIRYRQLVQHAPAGICEIDLQTMRFLNVNDVMCEYAGYAKDEFLNLDLFALLTGESWTTLNDLMENLRPENPTPSPVEIRIKAKDGIMYWVRVHTRFVFSEDGRPYRVTAVMHDLTHLKRAEEEKKRLEDKLVQVQKMESLGTLAGGIAHDFNNLLMGVQGNASLMLLDADRSRDDMERLNNIESYVQRGVNLTRQLLGLARGGKYEIKPINLNDLTRESTTMFSRTKKEIRVHQKLQAGIWTVECDRGQIDQVLLNIFVNAWQAMPTGGDLFVATANTELDSTEAQQFSVPPGRYVKISIADTGIGMDNETISKIFDPFFTTKERERGTGLGLASVYGIVKNHGGFVDVTSRIGEGSIFEIYLPATEKKVVSDTSTSAGLVRGSERILFVDDESMILGVARQLLEKMGYTVTTSQSGIEAVHIYRENHRDIDLVILDMVMPDMSGEEAFEQLYTINSDIRVLLSSGYSLDGQAARILSRGCRGFIQKPFNSKELSSKIRQILDSD